MNSPKLLRLACAVAGVFSAAVRAQTTTTAATPARPEEPVVLSPFTVTTDKDTGYRATNSISGTRLNTAIKDLPMPIEVITEQFIRDTGSTDLRESVRYSSGILLQTQNDYSAPAGSFSTTPGKINNPEGLTASPDQTHMKIRGFQTASVLRDGFRRQNATDSINVSRIEVARGPASLLYGVGNFGGVVNYLTKVPDTRPGGEVTFSVGGDDFKRGTLDTTGPVTGTTAYRLTAAVQDTGSPTDFNTERHYFVSPVITWRPFRGTEVLFDAEYGQQEMKGISWQNLRAAVSGFVNDSAGYNGSFLAIPAKDVKTFRWSGPDTYRRSTAANFALKLTQKLTDHLHLLAGVNRSSFDFNQLDNLAALRRVSSGGAVPATLIAPITYAGLVSNQAGVAVGPQNSTISYQWEKHRQVNRHDQVRVELNYAQALFPDGSRWLRMNNSFLAGLNHTEDTQEDHTRQTPGNVANYHNPTDYSYLRFGTQGDGSPDQPLVEWDNQKTVTSNPAFYGVYQGKLLNDRLTLIAGARRDRSWNRVGIYNPEYNLNGTPRGDRAPRTANSDTNRDTTYQWGANFAVARELSFYVMRSEGVEPNYQGKLDFTGKPLQAALATNKELGLKFDLLNGRISGTLSRFQITRTRSQVGSSSLVWFAPVVSGNLKFDPKKDIVYNVNEQNPLTNPGNKTAVDSLAQWNAAVASGAIYQATNATGSRNWYVNASKPTGAAFLDAIFANAVKNNYAWWGWLYGGSDPGSLPFDNLVNNSTMDDNGAQKSVATGSDRASGWDTQILLRPTENLQVALSWSHITKVVLNAQAWAKYPHPQDRWAIWYAPYTFAATAGRPLNQVYASPEDTSTFTAFGTGLPLDDTPKNQGTFWINYQFAKHATLKGWSAGVGGFYESGRVVYPAYGQNALDANGNSITLVTPSRTTFNGMLRYGFKLRDHDSSVQLNVENLTNDTKRYGFLYATPRRWRLQFGYKL